MTRSLKNTLLDVAELIDAYRVVPRLSVIAYGYLLYLTTIWFIGLDQPTTAQSTFVSVLFGAATGFFGFYVNSGRKWDKYSNFSQPRSTTSPSPNTDQP